MHIHGAVPGDPAATDRTTASGARSTRTAATAVFEQLRRDILDCDLRPGEKLRFDYLHRRYRAGVGTLREALWRLAADELVRNDAQRGFTVATASADDLRDVMELRLTLEPHALAASIARGNDAWEASVLYALHMLTKAGRSGVNGQTVQHRWEWRTRHRAFHSALLAACGSPWTERLCGLLFDHVERYWCLAHNAGVVEGTGLGYHQAIADAALARHEAQAVELVRRHILDTTKLLSELWLVEPAAYDASVTVRRPFAPNTMG